MLKELVGGQGRELNHMCNIVFVDKYDCNVNLPINSYYIAVGNCQY